MRPESITSEVKKAQNAIAEILELLEGVTQWCMNNAALAINGLQEDWENICSKAKSTSSKSFLRRSKNLLQDCTVFRTLIIERAEDFVDKVENRLPQIRGSAENNDETASLMDQIINRWNEVEHPQLMFLYEKLEELESSIQDIMALPKEENG